MSKSTSRFLSVLAVCLAMTTGCDSTPSAIDSTVIDLSGHDTTWLDAGADLSPGVDNGSADAPASDSTSTDSIGPALCPGGKAFSGGGISGIYTGTAKVEAGTFNKAGTHPATLALASVCGTLRGLLVVKQSTDPMSGTVSYKAEAKPQGSTFQLTLSDRYCAAISCMPHLSAGAGTEIFDVDVQLSGNTLTSTKVSVHPGVSYTNLELPFAQLTMTRSWPATPHAGSAAALDGTWVAKLQTTTEVFAEPPVDGDNELTLSGGKVTAWKLSFTQNALADKLLFPSAILDPTYRRVSVTHTTAAGTYVYSAVLDGNWLIGVARDASATSSTSPDVPTDFTPDDALRGVWIGYRKSD